MKRILIPIDGTERSLHSLNLLKTLYSKDDVDVSIIMVKEDFESLRSESEFEKVRREYKGIIAEAAKLLDGYNVHREVVFGAPGDEILAFADSHKIDIIIITKSTRKGWTRILGSVATHVVKYAKCLVMIVPE